MTEKIPYNPQDIEPRWQEKWEADKLYKSEVDWSKPKHYALTMLPYPSGDLHIGHWFAMTPSDARARYMRMKGYNVLFPMGFDAFGLPAENAAVQRGIHPADWTYKNMANMRGQMRRMGAMFDWEREMVSCDPVYYKWTEWFFKTFYENDLAYRGEAMVNWSEALQTVLANEQVIDGKDERLGQPVIQKLMTQWFFRYTRYADELLDFSGIDWPDPIRTMQTNWIGRSEGAHVAFQAESGDVIEVYTTRPDTLWGATFMVLAPEHPLVEKITTPEQADAVKAYQKASARKTEIERSSDDREKTGVFTGGYALNPVSGEKIQIWIADYVMISYGSGAIMAVPAHDERDFAFARRFDLPVRVVILAEGGEPDGDKLTEAAPGAGVMINSGAFDGTASNGEKGRKNPAIAAVIDHLKEKGIGREAVNYRLRDWLISRQRYWGSPIPVVYTVDGTIETVPDNQLPVELPRDVEMTGFGNPLAQHETFVHTLDSQGRPARRETDTMDTFMCSSWYHLRYLSPDFERAPFDPEEAAYWLPVDTYTGGAEHATMHLLYSRWFNKAMRDTGVFDATSAIMREHGRDPKILDEPMLQLRNQGQILGETRRGDYILAAGWIDPKTEKMFAARISVSQANGEEAIEWAEEQFKSISSQQASINPAFIGQDRKIGDLALYEGELWKRTENLLTLRAPGEEGTNLTVEVVDGGVVEIAHIPGVNTVNQLKHHLEVERMSKSRGNVVNPDDLVRQYGADTVRAYLMFAFDYMKGGPWDSQGVKGVVRWINDMWDFADADLPETGDAATERHIERRVHQAIERIGKAFEDFGFNTVVAQLMTLRNELKTAIAAGKIGRAAFQDAMNIILRLMAPITPHIAEELWAKLGGGYSVHTQSWPEYDAAKAAEDVVPLVIMVNGKVRGHVEVAADISEGDAKTAALESEWIVRQLDGGQPKRVIFIGGREPKVNVVV